MDLNNFTEKSREALTEAQNIGTRLQHQAVDVEHLMLALFEQQGGLVRNLFEPGFPIWVHVHGEWGGFLRFSSRPSAAQANSGSQRRFF